MVLARDRTAPRCENGVPHTGSPTGSPPQDVGPRPPPSQKHNKKKPPARGPTKIGMVRSGAAGENNNWHKESVTNRRHRETRNMHGVAAAYPGLGKNVSCWFVHYSCGRPIVAVGVTTDAADVFASSPHAKMAIAQYRGCWCCDYRCSRVKFRLVSRIRVLVVIVAWLTHGCWG